MKTKEFYLDNEKFAFNNYSGEKISLPVYNIQREDFNLVFPKKDNLVPLPWLTEVRYSLIQNKKQLITLQVTYQSDGIQNLDDEERIIILPQSIQGGWQEAGEWLSENYPTIESCQFVTYLDCSKKLLTGCLDLSNFEKLEEVNCTGNYLTELVIPEWVKKVNASSNSITSFNNVEVNWETINLGLDNNPLNITEIVATIKSLHQNSELDRQEIEKFRKQLEISQQNLQKVKDNYKNNIQILKKEHQEEIEATQKTIAELDKKLTKKEEELKKLNQTEQENKVNSSLFLSNYKVEILVILAIFFLSGIIYCCRQRFFK